MNLRNSPQEYAQPLVREKGRRFRKERLYLLPLASLIFYFRRGLQWLPKWYSDTEFVC